jgi:hypothetical protein
MAFGILDCDSPSESCAAYRTAVARRRWRPRGVDGAFRVVDVFATAAEVAARLRQRKCGLRIVGLLRAPSLTLLGLLAMTVRVCEGLPALPRHGVGSTNDPALVTFASPWETRPGSRGLPPFRILLWRAFGSPRLVPARIRAPLMGLSEIAPPSASMPGVHSQPHRCSAELSLGWDPEALPRSTRCCLRPGAATLRTRSALAVPPGFDGLLLPALFRFIAP